MSDPISQNQRNQDAIDPKLVRGAPLLVALCCYGTRHQMLKFHVCVGAAGSSCDVGE